MDSEPISEKKITVIAAQNKEQKPAPLEKQVLPDQIGKDVPLAEDIARFRTELEQKILWEGLPFKKWRQAYNQTLSEYPQILAYKPILDMVMLEVESSRNKLDETWKETHPKGKEFKEDEERFVPQTAEPEAARKLFSKLFGFEPKGNVEAVKGAISLRLTVDDDDYRRLRLKEGQEISSEAYMEYHAYGNFPVIVERKKIKGEETQEISFLNPNLHHELEHARNAFLEIGRHTFFYFPSFADMRLPKEISERLQRRHGKEPEMEKSAKDEILAFFSAFESIEMKTNTHVTDDNQRKQLDELLDEGASEFKVGLVPYFEENGYYFELHKNRYNPSDEEQKRYSSNAKRGVDSLTQLYELYRNSEHRSRAARMSINVLEQFPLNSWPAVVRLISSRHNQSKLLRE
ncbi:MAG: hypothetical protein A3F30_01315 [Candidatus Levybacteria bacterium RIFCSPHIGHO2_12_FULL_37_12]|nr:MAG: hypothetical protein A3F30_01315 [Candidatus Levybacteria bacterium RIFCSPHIGHO2_12_FULL_37_12]